MKRYKMIPKNTNSRIKLVTTHKEITKGSAYIIAVDQNGIEWEVRKSDYEFVAI